MTGPVAVNTLIDSLSIYVENVDYVNSTGSVASVLTVTASATGTYNGSDFTNTTNTGGVFFVNFTTVTATCTVRFNIQSKDNLSGLYTILASVSMDAVATAAAATVRAIKVYPGIGTAGATNNTNFSDTFTKTMRLQASITATASVGSPATSFTVGLGKIL